MATDLKEHYCGHMPRMASITFNKSLRYTKITELFKSGFELELTERKKEGKLTPKLYQIKVPVDYCPFCGEKLEPKAHLESCDCDLCDTQKVLRGSRYEDG